MKINVTENKLSIKEEQILNENEYNIHKIQFDFSSEYTDDLVKVALFSIDNHTYKKIISNNECDIPPEVLTQRGYSILGVYAYKTEQDTLVLRYSPSPTKISVYDGSYKADAENSEPITPSEIEQYQQILQNSLQQFQNQYNALVEETEGDIQAIEDELQRKVDEGYFDGEDGFSPIAKVIQKSNGATIEIEDKNGKTTADVLNGEDGYTPQRGIDYWTEEDKQEVEEEATQQIEGKIEEYNENAAEKLNQYNQNSVQKTNDYNTNAEQKMSAYNTNATEKTSTYNTNATEKFNNYNSNAEQKETNYNTNASSKLSEYNSNAETKKSAYDENATQKTNSFNTNATNKLTEYNTNHTEKMSAYNSNSTEKLNAFNENATQKTEDFDEHTEEIQDNIEKLQTENARFKATLPTTGEVTGQDITLDKTAELEFKKPPLPMGNSEQVQTTQSANLFDENYYNNNDLYSETVYKYAQTKIKGNRNLYIKAQLKNGKTAVSGLYACLCTERNPNISGAQYKMFVANGNQNADVQNFTTDTDLYFCYYPTTIAVSEIFENYNLWVATSDISYVPFVPDSPSPDYPSPITNVTGDVEVVVENKNLFDGSLFSSLTRNEDGTYKTNTAYTAADYVPMRLKPNTQYVISLRDVNYNLIVGDFGIYVDDTYIGSTNNMYKFTSSSSEITNIKIAASGWATVGTVNRFIQLEENSTATPYTPHKEQKFIFPLGNEKLMLGDYLADDGIHHVRGQVVFDGSESWGNNGETSDYGQYLLLINNKKYGTTNIISNKFITKQSSIENCIAGRDNSNYISITVDKKITPYSKDNFKTWLQTQYNNETPVTAEYELEQEVIVPYTSAQQEVYNQIKQAISYEERTNISSNQNALFDVEAYLNSKVILAEKYVKPSTGIPKTDLESAVQTSLNKADSAIQEHQDISGKEDKTNKVTSIDNTSTDTQYPSAKCVYDSQEEQNTEIEKLQTENARFKATLPTTGEVTGQDITLDKTAELEFKKPPLPMGNSEQVQYSGKNLLNCDNPLVVTIQSDISCTLPVGSYIINCSRVETTGSTNYMVQAKYEDDTNGYFTMERTSLKATVTFAKSVKAIRIYSQSGYQQSVGITSTFYNLMIRDSSITDDTYEPYVRTELQAHHQTIHKK